MALDTPLTLPLVSHTEPSHIIAWSKNGPVTVRQFLTDVTNLAAKLLPGQHLLNVCHDRYHFSVGLAAAITTGRISLLPASHTPNMADQLRKYAKDVFCLTDNASCEIDLPQVQYPDDNNNQQSHAQQSTFQVPEINVDQCVATVFTSGSTGTPIPHNKTWGSLVQCVKTEAELVGLLHNSMSATLIGTVPPQHMYGFESTLLMPWQSGHAISYAHPFYPADICQALSEVPSPRILISTPVHLRALIDAELPLPETACVLSATAPLSKALAEEIEARFKAPLIEIYGSTETGQIASKRATQTCEWTLFDGVVLNEINGSIYANGGHLTTPTKINDKIECLTTSQFLLHGRLTDMINIAGKRHSLASLNHRLNNISGIIDGVFYMPDENNQQHITRLAAFVVAEPGTSAKQILASLRQQLDPVFMPRPLILVDKLPRNTTGKLPRPLLQDLFNKKTNIRESA